MKKRRYNNLRGTFRHEQPGPYQSELERAARFKFSVTPGLLTIRVQEPKLSFSDPLGNPSTYTGDLHIHTEVGQPPMVVECKWQSEIDAKPDLKAELELLKQLFPQHGSIFFVCTDIDVYKDPRYESIEHVFGYVNHTFHSVEDEIVRAVRRRCAITVGELLSSVPWAFPLIELLPYVWRAVARRRIFVDYREVANCAMQVYARPLPTAVVNPLIPPPVADAIDRSHQRQNWGTL